VIGAELAGLSFDKILMTQLVSPFSHAGLLTATRLRGYSFLTVVAPSPTPEVAPSPTAPVDPSVTSRGGRSCQAG
jgi:hypothetical protein